MNLMKRFYACISSLALTKVTYVLKDCMLYPDDLPPVGSKWFSKHDPNAVPLTMTVVKHQPSIITGILSGEWLVDYVWEDSGLGRVTLSMFNLVFVEATDDRLALHMLQVTALK